MSKYGEQMVDLKTRILRDIKKHYGERCASKDTDDFPEMLEPPYMNNDKNWGRCPVCLVYEKFDEFWGVFYYDEESEADN